MSFLGKVPLDPAIVDSGDDGVPLVVAHPDSPAAQAYARIAATLAAGQRGAGGVALPFDWNIATGVGRPAPTPANGGAPDLPCAFDYGPAGLEILWADGETWVVPARDLRLACPCAACRDEITGTRLLDPEAVALTVAPTRIWSVGNYAIGIAFSDGHGSGIYAFPALRRMQGAETEDV